MLTEMLNSLPPLQNEKTYLKRRHEPDSFVLISRRQPDLDPDRVLELIQNRIESRLLELLSRLVPFSLFARRAALDENRIRAPQVFVVQRPIGHVQQTQTARIMVQDQSHSASVAAQ